MKFRHWTYRRDHNVTTARHAELTIGPVVLALAVIHHDYLIHEHGDRWVIRPALIVDIPWRLTRRRRT